MNSRRMCTSNDRCCWNYYMFYSLKFHDNDVITRVWVSVNSVQEFSDGDFVKWNVWKCRSFLKFYSVSPRWWIPFMKNIIVRRGFESIHWIGLTWRIFRSTDCRRNLECSTMKKTEVNTSKKKRLANCSRFLFKPDKIYCEIKMY